MDAIWSEMATVNISELNEVEQAETSGVISEAMASAKGNVGLIVREIRQQTTHGLKFDEPRLKTGAVEDLIELVRPFGFLPLTFLEFCRAMPGVNLTMDDRFRQEFPYSDPLYVDTIENILDICIDGSWKELMEENEAHGLPVYLPISPDYYHKDNISGGEAYAIEVTKVQTVDGRLLHTPHGELSFVQYLNTCFRHAGFPGIEKHNPFTNVGPQLKTI